MDRISCSSLKSLTNFFLTTCNIWPLFCLGMDIGIGKIDSHIKHILSGILGVVGTTRSTTNMHENSGTFLIFPKPEPFLHDTVIINLLIGIHLAQEFLLHRSCSSPFSSLIFIHISWEARPN